MARSSKKRWAKVMVCVGLHAAAGPATSDGSGQTSSEIVAGLLGGCSGYRLFDVFPGGPTYLVNTSKPIARALYPEIDAELMKLVKSNRIPAFQQGGFIEPATSTQGALRLQMAYGELCLNGLHSLGCLIAYDVLNKTGFFAPPDLGSLPPPRQIKADHWQFQIPMESSGSNTPIQVDVLIQEGQSNGWAGVSVPLKGENPVTHVSIRLHGRKMKAPLVQFQGITHLVLDSRLCPFPGLEAAKDTVLALARRFAKTHQGAFGVIWINPKRNQPTRMDPVVCLTTEPAQFFYEQSCGSGAAAVGIALADAARVDGAYRHKIIPPSAVALVTSGERSSSRRTFRSVYLEGPVLLRGIVRAASPGRTGER